MIWNDMPNLMSNNLHASVVYKFQPRSTITKSSTTFLFNDGLTWFKLEEKLNSYRYPHKKHVFERKMIDESNMPMKIQENKFLRMHI